LKIPYTKRAGGVAQVVKYLPSKQFKHQYCQKKKKKRMVSSVERAKQKAFGLRDLKERIILFFLKKRRLKKITPRIFKCKKQNSIEGFESKVEEISQKTK
jgi:hypothetical protein